MAKVDKLEKELQDATKCLPKPKEKREAYLVRLHAAAVDMEDDAWENLSEKAQGWVNAATRAHDADKPIPDFGASAADDEEESEEETESKPKKKAKAKVEDEDAEEDEPAPKKKSKAAAKDEPEEDEEEEPMASAKAKKGAAKKAAPKEDAKPAKKAVKAKKGNGDAAGYKGHRPGSSKEQVHKMFDDKGADAAIKLASKLGLAAGTPRSWISAWARK